MKKTINLNLNFIGTNDDDELIIGSDGDDTFTVTKGMDKFKGGAGEDTIIIPSEDSMIIRAFDASGDYTGIIGEKFLYIRLKENGSFLNEYTIAYGVEFIEFEDVGRSYNIVPKNVFYGGFIRHNFNKHFSLRATILKGKVDANDNESKRDFRKNRNLSFQSSITEFSTQIEFNFFPYKIGTKYNKTTYVFLGIGVFSYNPMGEFNGEWYDLRTLCKPTPSPLGLFFVFRLHFD